MIVALIQPFQIVLILHLSAVVLVVDVHGIMFVLMSFLHAQMMIVYAMMKLL